MQLRFHDFFMTQTLLLTYPPPSPAQLTNLLIFVLRLPMYAHTWSVRIFFVTPDNPSYLRILSSVRMVYTACKFPTDPRRWKETTSTTTYNMFLAAWSQSYVDVQLFCSHYGAAACNYDSQFIQDGGPTWGTSCKTFRLWEWRVHRPDTLPDWQGSAQRGIFHNTWGRWAHDADWTTARDGGASFTKRTETIDSFDWVCITISSRLGRSSHDKSFLRRSWEIALVCDSFANKISSFVFSGSDHPSPHA